MHGPFVVKALSTTCILKITSGRNQDTILPIKILKGICSVVPTCTPTVFGTPQEIQLRITSSILEKTTTLIGWWVLNTNTTASFVGTVITTVRLPVRFAKRDSM